MSVHVHDRPVNEGMGMEGNRQDDNGLGKHAYFVC